MLREKTDRIVIRSRISTPAKVLITMVGVATFMGLLFAAYRYGYSEANYNWHVADQTTEDLKNDLELMTQENEDLRTSITQAQRQLQIDQAAYKELSASLNVSSAQITELHKELKFYRSIISPSGGGSGVQIQDLVIKPTEKADIYKYKLVLIQALRHSEEVSGTVGFEIKGSNNDRPKVVKYPGSSVSEIRVNFRYFQNLEGIIDLPPNFSPEEIKVSVSTRGKSKKSQITERIYPWPVA
ncbi:MAG: hypothetical protein OEN01_15675 [Candidatus Krumholzibacteria bacterium]|nr:hypothetical protein [Candidatus Krumholzibacteria bacterium]